MKPSLLITLLLLVLLPLGLLAWAGQRAQQAEEAQLREQLRDLLARRLEDVNRQVAALAQSVERELDPVLAEVEREAVPLLAASAARDEAEAARLITRFRRLPLGHRLAQHVFVADGRGRLVFPPADAARRQPEEQAFWERSREIWQRGALGAAASESGAPASSRWQVWFHGTGPRFLYWTSLPPEGQGKAGLEISAAALTALLLAALPDNTPAGAPETMAFTLTDAQGQPQYHWGRLPGESDEKSTPPPVVAETPLAAPFGAWKLSVRAPAEALGGAGSRVGWRAGLASAALVLGWLAFHLYRESTRVWREAAQRVSFVNQVSHELKTPLTNIALYADLAGQRLENEAPQPPAPAESAEPAATGVRECLSVISSESARLGRLINNVLAFSKHQHGRLQPRLRPVEAAAPMRAALEPFARAFAEKGLAVEWDLRLTRSVLADPEWLEQIISNLLSNVEKYASAGGVARLGTREAAGRAELWVADLGPGVPPALREKIFAPFFRASDRVDEGVSGTGLGLAIARGLAHAMGGTLEMRPPADAPGAVFVLALPLAEPAAM